MKQCLGEADACVLGSRERLVYFNLQLATEREDLTKVYTVPEPHNVALVIGNCFPSDIANTSSICC